MSSSVKGNSKTGKAKIHQKTLVIQQVSYLFELHYRLLGMIQMLGKWVDN